MLIFFSFLFLLTFHVFSVCSSSKKASVFGRGVCVCVMDKTGGWSWGG